MAKPSSEKQPKVAPCKETWIETEISQWEKRIKTQGKPTNRKRGGLLPKKKKSSPNDEIRRMKLRSDDAQTLKQNSNPVKPKLKRSLFANPAGARYKTKEGKNVRPTKAILQYIDAWNASLFPKCQEFKSKKDQEAGKQTKVYQNTVWHLQKLIKGTLYSGSESDVRFPSGFQRGKLRIPIERFQYLIKNLEKKAFNSDYKPNNKTYLSKITLPHFLVGNGNFGARPSCLLDYALTPAIPKTHTKPKDPRLAEIFKELFLFKVSRQEGTLTFAERNHLVGASNKYLDFFIHFKGSFEVYGYKDPIDFLDEYYWAAIDNGWPGRRLKKIPLGYLNSNALINKVVIPYFLEIGILKSYDFEGTTENYWR